jgi:hypothetical protein
MQKDKDIYVERHFGLQPSQVKKSMFQICSVYPSSFFEKGDDAKD